MKIFKFESCKSCVYTYGKSKICNGCDGENRYDELYDADENCLHKIIHAGGGGIRCTKCKGWFCY